MADTGASREIRIHRDSRHLTKRNRLLNRARTREGVGLMRVESYGVMTRLILALPFRFECLQAIHYVHDGLIDTANVSGQNINLFACKIDLITNGTQIQSHVAHFVTNFRNDMSDQTDNEIEITGNEIEIRFGH
jgi:hypothetical protein